MRLLKNKKGQIRVIEAFFASVLLLSILTLIPIMQKHDSGSSNALSLTPMDVLAGLDSNGHLANLSDSRNWTALKNSVQSCIPLTVWFNITIFDENMTRLNDEPICSGSAVSDTIESADYVCPSINANYVVYVIRLQLAGWD